MVRETVAGLLALQGQIKRDPQSYEEEFLLQYRHFKACLDVYNLKPSEESSEFSDLVAFIAQVAQCYPERSTDVVSDLSLLLERHSEVMNSALRHTLVKSLILLRNRKAVGALQLLPLFFRLFRCQDKSLRQMVFRHIVSDISAANQKHQDSQLNRAVQNFLYKVLQDPHEAAAKKSLAVLIELWRRQIWRDARTVNVIASAGLQSSSSLMLAALKFFLGQDEIDHEESEDDDESPAVAQPTRTDIFRATKKGTVASKKKKEAKLKRVMAAVKKQQRHTKRRHANFAAVQLLHDPQDFAEALFKRLHKSAGERFEVRITMMTVISRVIGVHKLLLLNFYPFMQKFVLPHQRDAPGILAILVQAVHEEVPPDALDPVLRQLVDQFVHDRARPEVMTLGLKTVRELCQRAPLIMTQELLQDLALYKKFREKEVASAARSLIALFREVAPAMLEKRDRGRDAALDATPLAFGARRPVSRVEGAELLQAELEDDGATSSEEGSPPRVQEGSDVEETEGLSDGDASSLRGASCAGSEDEATLDYSDRSQEQDPDQEQNDSAASENVVSATSAEEEQASMSGTSIEAESGHEEGEAHSARRGLSNEEPARSQSTAKRKRAATVGSLGSLRKQLAQAKAAKEAGMPEAEDQKPSGGGGILEQERFLTEEDFSRIRELRHDKMVEELMRKHGLKSAAKRERLLAAATDEAEEALDRLDTRASIAEEKVASNGLIGRHKTWKSKEDRLATVLEGRKGRQFGAAASRKHNKAGGRSNKEKIKKKNLPLGARKAVVKRREGKQRVGRKNFKGRSSRFS